ncbi:MAG: glucose-6-phosphate isomerase [Nitratiruptor sp.]|nr:glucose-6-phosphate isomerase [Nitratiruptor sp.]NPA83424.1 glucose-6-phosphate isomerase [Campylobacterota bacterium]
MIFYEARPAPASTQWLYEALVAERSSGKVGYYHLPDHSLPLIQRAQELDWGFETIVHIGIGGSSLGPKALAHLFASKLKRPIIFLENPDPVEIRLKLASLDPQKAQIFVVSKSGRTVETLAIFKALLNHFQIDPKGARNIAVITDPDSPLDRFASWAKVPSFHIPPNVGGRFSVLSAVGIVPLTLAGLDTAALLEGARTFRELFFAQQANHLLAKALFFAHNAKRYPITVLFSYASELEEFTRWYVQLWGESLGKRKGQERVGLTPVGLLGTSDQHSFLQLLIDGPRDKSVTFLKVARFGEDLPIGSRSLPHLEGVDFLDGHSLAQLLNAECDATKRALELAGVPNDLIELQSLDEESIGELIFYFQLLTSATALALGINAYDQPGVELGKRVLRQLFSGDGRQSG